MKTIDEIAKECKEDFGGNLDRENAFIDAYTHGCYHEPEDGCWQAGCEISDKTIKVLILNSINWAIRADPDNQSGKKLETIMRLHEMLALFLRGVTKSHTRKVQFRLS